MPLEDHVAGFATETASFFLRDYATRIEAMGSSKQAEHVRFVDSQMRSEFLALRSQLEHARRLAVRYEGELARYVDRTTFTPVLGE